MKWRQMGRTEEELKLIKEKEAQSYVNNVCIASLISSLRYNHTLHVANSALNLQLYILKQCVHIRAFYLRIKMSVLLK